MHLFYRVIYTGMTHHTHDVLSSNTFPLMIHSLLIYIPISLVSTTYTANFFQTHHMCLPLLIWFIFLRAICSYFASFPIPIFHLFLREILHVAIFYCPTDLYSIKFSPKIHSCSRGFAVPFEKRHWSMINSNLFRLWFFFFGFFIEYSEICVFLNLKKNQNLDSLKNSSNFW